MIIFNSLTETGSSNFIPFFSYSSLFFINSCFIVTAVLNNFNCILSSFGL
jgi:hypothetical protein